MSNWKNVNNWHWVDKNCLPWAKNYFQDKFIGMQVESAGHTVSISGMDECTGDVEICQRKGKIITIYDVAVKYSWKGVAADGTEAAGTLQYFEVAHDVEADEMEFKVTVKEEDTLKRTLRDIVKKELVPLVTGQLVQFRTDLVQAHGTDVHIPADQLGQAAPARESTPVAK
ncbi:putative Hch1 protein [Hesseltinella vesiculosa]|uniref:Putative Hch1 protein n=1 Tax=Hesseltinella vesiculosa TaxID=101127 RepID=A0A1X2GHJ8_9FUNG|nr:putative Hch1 protein [Hesseltinella vesiculosa]